MKIVQSLLGSRTQTLLPHVLDHIPSALSPERIFHQVLVFQGLLKKFDLAASMLLSEFVHLLNLGYAQPDACFLAVRIVTEDSLALMSSARSNLIEFFLCDCYLALAILPTEAKVFKSASIPQFQYLCTIKS